MAVCAHLIPLEASTPNPLPGPLPRRRMPVLKKRRQQEPVAEPVAAPQPAAARWDLAQLAHR